MQIYSVLNQKKKRKLKFFDNKLIDKRKGILNQHV